MTTTQATKIVDAVLKDLRGRKRIGDELGQIEDDVYQQMKNDLVVIVQTT